jgi:flagellar hook assembly protein FlgD
VTAVDGAPKASGEGDVRFAAVPNPVAAGTRLSFSLPPQASAHLEIYDSAGRLVRKLREFAAGHAPDEGAWWDGRTDRGVALPSGAYYARLRWSGGSRTVRVVISR